MPANNFFGEVDQSMQDQSNAASWANFAGGKGDISTLDPFFSGNARGASTTDTFLQAFPGSTVDATGAATSSGAGRDLGWGSPNTIMEPIMQAIVFGGMGAGALGAAGVGPLAGGEIGAGAAPSASGADWGAIAAAGGADTAAAVPGALSEGAAAADAAGGMGALNLADAGTGATMSDVPPAWAGSMDAGVAPVEGPGSFGAVPPSAQEMGWVPYNQAGDTSAFTGAPPTDVPAPVSTPGGVQQSTVDRLLGGTAKYGPLALGAAGLVSGRSAANQAGNQIRQIGAPQQAVGNQLISQYQSGQLNANDSYNIQQWQQSATAQAKQYFAKAGLSDSSQAQQALAQIGAQAEAMKAQALQNYLTQGMSALNITDQYQLQAVLTELQGSQQATAAATNFLGAYGSWLRGLNTSTGQTAATPAA